MLLDNQQQHAPLLDELGAHKEVGPGHHAQIVDARGNVVKFAISPLADHVGADQVLPAENIRHRLKPRPSPFVAHGNYGGGFVHDQDLVALQALKFADRHSSGATRLPEGIHEEDLGDAADAEGGAAGAGASWDTDRDGHSHAASSFLADPALGKLAPRAPSQGGPAPDQLRDVRKAVLPAWAIRAGARETVYFEPAEVKAAIVMVGGLCPGSNDVVRGLVNKLEDYGVPPSGILGVRYGFKGLYDKSCPPVQLSSRVVEGIHMQGGAILGTSGADEGGADSPDIERVVRRIDVMGINMVFVIGGEGGHSAALDLQQLLDEKQVPCAVVGIPKSIDNDMMLIDKTFGFDTAVEEAQRALYAAKVEASSAFRGVGIVKIMGKQSGFIAMQASLASGVVDVCLIPEVPFEVDGDHGLYAFVNKILEANGHVVICVAEGAGQNLVPDDPPAPGAPTGPPPADAPLKDVGKWLKKGVKQYLKGDCDIKYIDPTYMIRAIPATSGDRIYAKILAHNAVHAAFAGFTGVSVGLVNTHYVYLPLPVVIAATRRVDPRGKMWNRLRHAIGQPNLTAAPGDDPERASLERSAGSAHRALSPFATPPIHRSSGVLGSSHPGL